MNRLIDVVFNPSVLLSFSYLLFIILVFVFYKKFISNKKNVLRLVLAIPLLTGIIHFFIYNFHNAINTTFFYFKTIYIVALFIFITSFFLNRKKVFIILNSISLLGSLVSLCLVMSITVGAYSIHNFSYLGYRDSFLKLMDTLEKEYPLNEWKDIDYVKLKEKYFLLIQQAEKNKDKSLYYSTIFEFMNEFKDGHVMVACTTEDCWRAMSEKYENRYYGFGTIKVDNGDIISIMVDENSEAYRKGLRNGYRIIKRDGKDINYYLDKYYFKVYSYAVKSTEELFASMYIFNTGDDSTEITFIDNENNENTIVVNSTEYNLDYYTPLYYLLYSDMESDNFSTKMLTDKIGYININSITYSKIDILTYLVDDASHVKKNVMNKLNELSQNGMEKLVIDLRSNGGGFVHLASAIASPFLSGKFTYMKSEGKVTGKYDYMKVNGTGEYYNLPIVVLVNSDTASAADSLINLLQKNPNIKVMGYMSSANSCQEIGGRAFLTDGDIEISYPLFKSETPNGNVYIDTGSDGVETIKLDVKIPITKENIMSIIDYKGDYVLDYAIDYLNQSNW